MKMNKWWLAGAALAGAVVGCTMHIPGKFEDVGNPPARARGVDLDKEVPEVPSSQTAPATFATTSAPLPTTSAPFPTTSAPLATHSAAVTPVLVTLSTTTNPTGAIPETDGYKLVWHDEFNVDGPLNSADWGYENGFVRNQEVQWYQPENAVCKDGMLVIEARKESKPNPRYVAPSTVPATTTAPGGRGRGRGGRGGGGAGWPNLPTIEITAASVNTRGKHEWTYGRFEIRAKIDVRSGSWPAFWTLGTAGGWPGNGEVDIMEYYRDMVLANVAWQGANGAAWNSVRNRLETLPADFAKGFHTWRMDWDAQAIKLYLDDKLVNEQDLSKTVNTGGRGAGVNPFIDRPVYLLLNQAIGGQNGGDPSKTEFPVKFLVDYVRVWQKPGAGTGASGR